MIFLFQQSHGNNRVTFYEYKNNITWSALAKHLPEQINQIQDEQDATFGRGEYTKKQCPPNNSYYVNGAYRHVVSNSHYIKTTMEDKDTGKDIGTFRIKREDKNNFMVIEGVVD